MVIQSLAWKPSAEGRHLLSLLLVTGGWLHGDGDKILAARYAGEQLDLIALYARPIHTLHRIDAP
jgi:hypothetical protein